MDTQPAELQVIMAARISFFDHTADMGIRITATSREELVAGAIDGLYRAIGRLEGRGHSRDISFEFSSDDEAGLLRDLLAEILFLFEKSQEILLPPVEVKFADGRLSVTAKVVAIDAARSEFQHEVKAITYHELTMRPTAGGWEASIIVDI